VVPNVENFVGHKDAITALAFLPHSHTLFSAGADRLVKQWSLDEMRHVETLFGHQADITALDVPPGGPAGASSSGRGGKERAVTCSGDRTARLWKVSEGTQLVFRASATCGGLECVRAITDALFLTGAATGSLSLWSSARKRPIFTLHHAHGTGMHIPMAGTHAPPAALARARGAERSESADGSEGAFAAPGTVSSLAVDGDGRGPPAALLRGIAAATGCGEGGLSGGYCSHITALALLPSSDVFASGSGDGFVRLWRLVAAAADGGAGGGGGEAYFSGIEHLAALPLKGIVNGLAFSSDGRTLVAAVGTEHRLGRWWRYSGAKNGVAVVHLPVKA